MAQTAVESIIVDLDNECKARGMFVNWDMYLAMEKEQIISAHLAGQNDNEDIEGKTEIEYYHETYNMEQTAVNYSNLDLDTMYNKYKNHSPHKLANDEMFNTEDGNYMYFTKEQFIDNIKTNDRFLNKWL